MKKIRKVGFLLLIVTFFAACENDHVPPTPPNNNNNASIVGANDPAVFGDGLIQQSYQAALFTANYLIAQAQSDVAGEYYWRMSNHSTSVSIGQDRGVTSIGRFFLQLYQITNHPIHLEYAQGAAQFIINSLATADISHDWYAGHAGAGEFLLELYNETFNQAWLIHAEFIANKMIEKALSDPAGGVYWLHWPGNPKIYTGIAHGNAGASLFLLKLFAITGNHHLLTISIEAHTWLAQHKMPITDQAVAWKRLSYDNFIYHGWCSGAAGMVPMFHELYYATQAPQYFNLLQQIGHGLVESAITQPAGVAWPRDLAGGESFFTTYCQGAAGIVDTLFYLHQLFPDSNFDAVAHQGLEWLTNESIQYPTGGIYWPVSQRFRRFDVGYQMGVASVARAFITGYRNNPNPNYLNIIEQASELLLRIAHRPNNNQVYWNSEISITDMSEDPETSFNGWHDGNAGIGMYWIAVYQLLNEESP